MPGPDGIILGFDPGGKGNFGWSVCVTRDGQLQKPVQTCVANDALSALRAVEKFLRTDDTAKHLRVLAAGIDAPMFWSEKGDRKVDGCLRDALGCTNFKASRGGTVQAVNSLRGAAVVQGVLLGKHLMECWGTILITESHPRVLRHLLDWNRQRDLMKRLTGDLHCYRQYGNKCVCGCQLESGNVKHSPEDPGDHKLDATLAAISAWAMVHEPDGWEDLYIREPQPIQPFNTPVAYWMPKLQETQHS